MGRVKHDGVFVGLGLAGNLAKYDVVTAQSRKNQCGTPLRLGEIGEWKVRIAADTRFGQMHDGDVTSSPVDGIRP